MGYLDSHILLLGKWFLSPGRGWEVPDNVHCSFLPGGFRFLVSGEKGAKGMLIFKLLRG